MLMEQVKRLPYLSLAMMSAYAAYEMQPNEHPYAFSACAFGIIFGFYGLAGGEELECSVVKAIMDTGLDFIPLSLMNIELFLSNERPYAMIHALFIIPLILDVIAKLFGDEGDDEITQLLKNLNNFANVISLMSIGYVDDNYMFIYVALSFFTAQAAKCWSKCRCPSPATDVLYIMAYNAFYYTSILAVTVPNTAVKSE